MTPPDHRLTCAPNKEHGLTLVELLLTLGLLSGLSAVVASWSVTTLRGTVHVSTPARWRTAARSALRHMQEMLLVADEDADSTELRASTKDGILLIQARSPLSRGRTAIHAYSLDADQNALVLNVEDVREKRILLLDVREFEVELEEVSRTLSVRLKSPHGDTVERRFRVP